MKSIFTVAMLLFSFVASATSRTSCGFKSAEILRTSTGERVSQSFRPKIIANGVALTLDIKTEEVIITSLSDINIMLWGTASCHADDSREGFDCFIVREPQSGRYFYAFSSNEDQNLLKLESATGAPGGFVQVDTYSCRK